MGVDASPRSISPQRTGDESARLPPLMGQRLREAINHRSHDAYSMRLTNSNLRAL